ncbi:MAG: hypothetical protein ACYC6W_10920 [Nitrosotalea sp.]
MRPKDVNDLQIMWAIRDIPATILNLNQKALLFILATLIGNNEDCWYKSKNLCEKLGVSRHTLHRLLSHLEKQNLIFIDRPDHYTHNINNRYRLNYEQLLGIKPPKSYPQSCITGDTQHESHVSPVSKSCITGEQVMYQNCTPYIRKKKDNKKYKKRDSAASHSSSATPLSFFDFMPDERNEFLAQDLRIDLKRELESFKLDWQANGKRYADPQAAFSIWLKRAKEYLAKNSPALQSAAYRDFEDIKRERDEQLKKQYPETDNPEKSIEIREKALQDIKALTSKWRVQ